MANYVLDVSNVRVRQAMDFLGMEDSELVLKSFQDFSAPRISPEVQKLRYDYYTKKVRETARKIKHRMKEERQRLNVETGTASMKSIRAITSPGQFKSASINSFVQIEESKLSRIKEQQKDKILRTLTQFKQENDVVKPSPADLNKKTEAAEVLQEEIQKKKEELEKRKKQHEDKLQAIQNDRLKIQKELIRNMAQSMREHEERGKRLEENKLQEVRSRALSLQQKQTEVARKLSEEEAFIDAKMQEKLFQIEERINRNRQLHEESLKTKAEKAAKTRAKAESHASQLDSLKQELEIERIRRYAAAQKEASERKSELTKTQREKFVAEQEKVEVKMAKIKKLQKEQKKKEYEDMKLVEKRMSETNRVIEQKQKDWTKELELRLELQRLKDEDKRTKVERAQRIYVRTTQNQRRAKLIEKQIMDREKVEQMKKEHELKLAKHHETAIKMMIEKERGSELHTMVLKSPTSKWIQDKLKTLDIKLGPEPEVVESQ